MRAKHKTALVTIGEGYGNIVMATPVIAAVAELGYRTDVLVESHQPEATTLLSGWSLINTIYLNRETLQHDHTRHPYDAVVRTVWNRSGELGLGPEFAPENLSLATHHETDVNMTAVHRLGFSAEKIPPPHVEIEMPFWPLPNSFVAIAPGYGGVVRADWARKAWPYWPEFVGHLHEQAGLDVLVLGSFDDEEPWLTDGVTPWLHNLCGRTSIRGAAGIFSRSEMAIAVDNGLAHIAAALGRPTTILFGATSEIKNAPRGREVKIVSADLPCRPCQMTERWEHCTDWKCMAAIASRDVLAAIEDSGGTIVSMFSAQEKYPGCQFPAVSGTASGWRESHKEKSRR